LSSSPWNKQRVLRIKTGHYYPSEVLGNDPSGRYAFVHDVERVSHGMSGLLEKALGIFTKNEERKEDR